MQRAVYLHCRNFLSGENGLVWRADGEEGMASCCMGSGTHFDISLMLHECRMSLIARLIEADRACINDHGLISRCGGSAAGADVA